MPSILPVIMCGGSGTRMWPLSRESYPKQFLPLLGERSSFEETLRMLARPEIFAPPIAISNRDYRFLVGEQMLKAGVEGEIVLEPMRRDSGPAVAIAAEIAFRRDPQTVVAMLAADHAIGDREGFVALCQRAAQAATAGHIVTLGVKPDHAATGYGYIRPGASIGAQAFAVEGFTEKPDASRAAEFVAKGYLWNSGNFFFRADVMRAEIEAFEPEMAQAARDAVEAARRDLDFLVLDQEAFARAPQKSIDYAVMERTKKAAVMPADVGWSDIGSWAAVGALSSPDERGNVVRGEGVIMDASNVYLRSEDGLTAVVGVSDVIVVNTGDATLVVAASAADKVKNLVERLKSEGRREPLEHRRVYRPWGYYQTIDLGGRYQVKRISVKAGASLSLQKHHHRSEHWIVVRGAADVTIDDARKLVHENESIYLPIGCVHRLTNPGKIDLELIEVQTGSYLGEDDIVRLEDLYNRS
ncbi:MAG: mannose-1-phosphate guanylyltransferase/mannose-6-phosphate isomerase [Beijerinckiaceae bacterium]|nr:mannose-1-phosphate guanylyltransferase/mannose-6-phosphate isomerase [Beijerinckiaceae bacterium]